MRNPLIAAATSLLLPLAATAAEWSGEAELGYVRSDNSTATSDTLNAKAKVGSETEHWRHTARAEALFAESESDGVESKTAEKYMAGWKSERKLGQKSYWYGLINYETDRVTQLDYRVSEFLGYGFRLVKTERQTLDIEVGAGARQTSVNDESNDEAVGRLALNYLNKLSETAKFTEELSTEIGEESTITRSVTGLSAKIQDNLASKLTYTFQRVETDEASEDESIFAAALVFSY
jgi:putative salt-induced outer membrane protein YdiY